MNSDGNLGENSGAKEYVCAPGSDVSLITILRHASLYMVKRWLSDGTIKAYDHAKRFTIEEAPVSNIDELSSLLTRLEGDPHACLIRGAYMGAEPAGAITRTGRHFEDRPLHHILIEVDGYEPFSGDPLADPVVCCQEYILTKLPPCFHDASYHWQLSNSAGHPKYAGKLKVHLWFWMETPYTSLQLREWAKAISLACDHAVFNSVQIHYTGAPIFELGVADPVQVRSGMERGAVHAVPLLIEQSILDVAQAKVRPPRGELVGNTFDDPVAAFLIDEGLVLDQTEDQLYVKCPWDSGHSTGSPGDTSTAWLLAGTGNYAQGHFRCLHASCQERTDNDFQRSVGFWDTYALEGFVDETALTDSAGPVVPIKQADFQLLTVDDLAQRPPTRWCIKGVLPQTGLAAIYGPSGSGKSFLVIDLAMALASGKPWFKLRTKKCPVIYCALEGEGGVPQRVAAYRAQHGGVGAELRFLLQPFNLLLNSDVEALGKAIVDTGFGGGVTILDTLNRAAPGTDENDSKDMGQIIAAAKALQVRVGGLVLLIHHTGKDITKGLRGHSSLLAALDCAIEISRGGDVRSWGIAKSKDGLDGNAHRFRLDGVELGKDEDGDPITSCVISPDWDCGSAVNKVKLPRGNNQKISLKAIRELLQFDMSMENEHWPKSVPPGRSCIKLEVAIEKISDQLPSQRDQRNRNARKAIAGLVGSGLLVLKEGWLWEP